MAVPRPRRRVDEIARRPVRELVLDLAVRGKLVEQDPNDEPASELLKRIQAEKTGVLEEAGIRKEKVLRQLVEDELPFNVPTSWCWSQLAAVGFINPALYAIG